MYDKYICKFCEAHLDPGEKCDCDLNDVVEPESHLCATNAVSLVEL